METWIEVVLSILFGWGGPNPARWSGDSKGWPLGVAFLLVAVVLFLVQLLRRP